MVHTYESTAPGKGAVDLLYYDNTMKHALKLLGMAVGLSATMVLVAFMVATMLFKSAASSPVGVVPAIRLDEMSATTTTVTAVNKLKGRDSLESLRQRAENLECSFTFDDSLSNTDGTGFFSTGKMRVDAEYHGNATTTSVTSLIVNRAQTYVWGTNQNGPFAILSTTSVAVKAEVGLLTPSTVVQYECKPWLVDGSVFVPPDTITF